MKYLRAKGGDQPPEIIDMGMVGEITAVNSRILLDIVDGQFIPVIAPVGGGKEGETYNINADLVAGHLAASLGARKLVLLTDIEGVLDKDGGLMSTLTVKESLKMIQDGTIQGGMIPKINCCLEAMKGGVKKAHIIDGRKVHAILLEIFTKGGIGTEIIH